jgi:hypothetical protein
MSLSCTRWRRPWVQRIRDHALPWAVAILGTVGWLVLIPVAIWRLTP